MKKSSPIARENWIRVENTHEAIIPEESFQYVQSLLEIDTGSLRKENLFICFLDLYVVGIVVKTWSSEAQRRKGKNTVIIIAPLIKNKEKRMQFPSDQ